MQPLLHSRVWMMSEKRACSCEKWDLIGLSCEYATCCIIDKGHPLNPYVDECYRKEVFMRSFKYSFQLARGPNVWKNVGLLVLEPIVKKLTSRPKLKKVREAGEDIRSSQGPNGPNPRSFQLYSLCKLTGHKKKTLVKTWVAKINLFPKTCICMTIIV